jgi:hypothetical protein
VFKKLASSILTKALYRLGDLHHTPFFMLLRKSLLSESSSYIEPAAVLIE